MSIKIVHTGDAHVDSDVHGRINPETGVSRAWESNIRALTSGVDQALEEGVDLFVHNGDAFKNGRPSPEAVLLFAEALKPLAQAGVPVVLTGGNHDQAGVSLAQRTVTANVASILLQWGEVLVAERHPQLLRTQSGIQIAAMPWLNKSEVLASLGLDRTGGAEGDRLVVDWGLRELEKIYEQADDTAPLILAAHATVDDVRIEGLTDGHRRGSEVEIAALFAEPILPRKALEEGPAGYVGLSHIHARQRVGAKCYYAGSPNRITFADAHDPKSMNLVTLSDDNKLESIEFIPTEARLMEQVNLVDDDAEERIKSLEGGTLVKVVLPAEEPSIPKGIRESITERGAVIVATQRTRPEVTQQEVAFIPEKVDPVKAFSAWIDSTSDVDEKGADRLVEFAAAFVDEVEAGGAR